jgi:uncharacterized membrane protein
LRGAIPIAINIYGMHPWSAYFFSVLGNLAPLIGIVVLGKPAADFLSSKCICFKKLFDWVFAKVGKRANLFLGKIGRDLTIIILTAIPIPFVGGWTGAAAAVLLETPKKRGLVLVAIGAAISGIIILLLTLGLNGLMNTWLNG